MCTFSLLSCHFPFYFITVFLSLPSLLLSSITLYALCIDPKYFLSRTFWAMTSYFIWSNDYLLTSFIKGKNTVHMYSLSDRNQSDLFTSASLNIDNISIFKIRPITCRYISKGNQPSKSTENFILSTQRGYKNQDITERCRTTSPDC